MINRILNLLTSPDPSWDRRTKVNVALFAISYLFMGAVTGVLNDSYISYLNIVVPDVVKALPMYGSFGVIIISSILLLVPKIGYKKLILPAPFILIASILVVIYVQNFDIVLVANIIINVCAGLFDLIYPLMFTFYVPKDKRVSIFAMMMYLNYASQATLTFLNGKIVVWKFSSLLGVSYDTASVLSENVKTLLPEQLLAFKGAYSFTLWVAVVFTLVAAFFLFGLKEEKCDYQESEEELRARKAVKKFDFSLFLNKYILAWVFIFAFLRLGANLVVSYFPIYLNDYLHIPRGTTSTIISLQTLAMVIGFIIAPYLERKLGSIISIGICWIACIPLMLVMANGVALGDYVGISNLALVVGVVLFFRSGLANATNPIKKYLPFTFVPKNLVPAFSFLLMVSNAVVGIITGLFGRYYLFQTEHGYADAYYIAAGIYIITGLAFILIFKNKYNWHFKKDVPQS